MMMDRNDYRRKVMQLLDDETTYKKVSRDPTLKLERMNNELVKQLFEQKNIHSHLKRFLIRHNSLAPKFYGLPKIHKVDVPLRPVTSCIKSPTYFLSQFMSRILYNIRDDSINIRSSLVLKEKLSLIHPKPNYIFVSFDVVSLFTNVSVPLAVEVIRSRWKELYNIFTGIKEKLFFDILELCLSNGYCQFNNNIYSQIEGLAMGNPLSPS